jgi:hypothetical protein
MAEVTGMFGDQPIELNNAATESTLKELVAAMGILSAKVGGKAKGTQDIEKELKKFQEAVKKQTDATKDLTEEQKKKLARDKEQAKIDADKKKAEEESTKKTHAFGKALNTLGQTTAGVITGMTNLMSSLANVGNSMESAAASMNSIPIVGGVLASVFGAVAGSAEKLNKAYQTAASAGVTFGGSVNSMVNAASSAGLTFDQFAGIIQKNSESMMLLGGTTEAGAKRFAQLGKEIRNSGIGNELLRMGFSTEQINSGMAGYIGILGKTGALQNMSTKQIAASSAGYLKDLDALAKITGSTREEKQKEQEALMKDAQFRAATAGMDAEAQKQMMAYITSFPKEQQAAMKDMITTGNITSEESVKLAAMMPGAAQQAMAFGQQLQAGGKISRDQFNQAKNLSIQEAGVRVKEMKDQGLYNKEMAETYVGMADLAAQKIDGVNQAYAEQADSVKKANQAEEIEKFKQRLAETSNVFTQILAQSGLLEHLENSFQLMTGIVLDYVVPGFNFLANNFETVVGVAAVLGVAFLTLKGIIMYAQTVEALRTMGIKLSLAPLALFALKVGLVVAPIVGIIALFKYLYDKGWTFGSVLEAMVDNFKGFFLTIQSGFLSLLDKLTFGDANKKIKAAQKAVELEKEELAEKEKARDARRAEKAEERAKKSESALDRARAGVAAREAENADKKKAEEAKKAAEADKEKTEAANGYSSQVGQGNPLADMAMYGKRKVDEAAGRVDSAAQGAAAAGGTSGLGSLAARYESGGKGSEAVGYDSTGGTSFGKYQIATKTGTMDQFMKFLQKDNPEAYERLMAAGPADSGKDGKFAQEWKSLAKDGKLGDSEHKFIKATHYDKAMTGLGDATLQEMISKSGALQEVMWSTSVQHGAGGAKKIFESAFQKGMSEEELIKAVYASRAKKFGSSTAQVQASVQSRFVDEQSRALAMVGAPSMATPNGAQAVAATTNPPAKVAEAAAVPAAAPPRPASPGKSQESAETLLAQLNMQVGELIAITRDTQRINQRQLGAIADNGSNLYAMGA